MQKKVAMQKKVFYFLPLFFIIAVQLIIWHGSNNWWSADDPALLRLAVEHDFYGMFFSPCSYKDLTASNFTPIIFALFKLNFNLFGLNPELFFFQQFIVVCVVLFLFYRLCIKIIHSSQSSVKNKNAKNKNAKTSFGAVIATAVFMLTMPILEFSDTLMQCHYIMGLFFSLCAVHCYLKSINYSFQHNTVSFGFNIFACLFYLLSTLSKEIFIPLPCLLLFLPLEKWNKKAIKEHVITIIPMMITLIIYIVWRMWMIGSVGGYGLTIDLYQIIVLPYTLLTIIGTNSLFFIIPVFIFTIAVFFRTSFANKLFIIVFFTCVSIPVLPVIALKEIRYTLMPAFATGIVIGVGMIKFHDIKNIINNKALIKIVTPLSYLLVFCCIVSLGYTNIAKRQKILRATLEKQKIEGIYVLKQGNKKEYIKNPSQYSGFFSSLAWLRTNILKLSPGPKPLFDLIQLDRLKDYSIVVWNNKSKSIVIADNIDNELQKFYKTIRYDVPLWMNINYQDYLVNWEFGPEYKGAYTLFLSVNSYFDNVGLILQKGKFPLKLSKNMTVRIKYSSLDGWVTYSPVLELAIVSNKGVLKWKRDKL